MRALKNTFIIGIDHGYGNIKTANTVTPTGITTYNSEPTFSVLNYKLCKCIFQDKNVKTKKAVKKRQR